MGVFIEFLDCFPLKAGVTENESVILIETTVEPLDEGVYQVKGLVSLIHLDVVWDIVEVFRVVVIRSPVDILMLLLWSSRNCNDHCGDNSFHTVLILKNGL